MKESHLFVGYEANEFIVITAIPYIANLFSEKCRVLIGILLCLHLVISIYFRQMWKKNPCEKNQRYFDVATMSSFFVGLFLSWMNLGIYLRIARWVIILSVATLLFPIGSAYYLVKQSLQGKLKQTKASSCLLALAPIASLSGVMGFFGAKTIYSSTGNANILLGIMAIGCYVVALLVLFAVGCVAFKKILEDKFQNREEEEL